MSRSYGVYLCFQPPSGERLFCTVEPGRRFFLPATAPTTTVVVSDTAESGISIGIDETTQNATITADHDLCTILGNNNFRYNIPASSSSRTYIVIWRDNDNILTPTGRWELLWEDEHGSVHNSMRPPPLPTPNIPSDALEPLQHDDEPIVDATISDLPSTPATDNDSAIADVDTPQEANHDDDLENDKEIAEIQMIDSVPCPSTPLPGAWAAVNTINTGPTDQTSPASASSATTPEAPLPANSVEDSGISRAIDEDEEGSNEAPLYVRGVDRHTTDEIEKAPAEAPETPEERTHEIIEEKINKETSPLHASDVAEETTPDEKAAEDLPLEFTPASATVSKPKVKRWNIVPPQKATPSPQPSRKRSSEASSGASDNKRVRFSQSPNTGASETEAEDGDNEEEETIVVEPREAPSVKSASNSSKKRRKSSSTSPANKTVRQKAKEHEWTPKIYMAGNTQVDQGHKKVMRSFIELGGSLTKNIIEADVLCVGRDVPLVKSGSLLLALAHGIPIVTEDWIIDATRRDAFPDTARYLPKDPERERLWGFKLADAVAKGRQGLTHLLADKEVYFTKSLLDSVNTKVSHELSKLAVALGADVVRNFLPGKKTLKDSENLRKFIMIGAEGAEELRTLAAKGLTVYSKDLLTTAVLRGKLERKAFTIASAVKHEEDD